MLRWSRLLCTLLLVTKYGVVRSLKCPTSASDWDRASRSLQCQLPNYYHCLRDESGANTERCIPKILIQSQKCPMFNKRVSKIDVSGCSVANCPASAFLSNAVFMYPICFENKSALSYTIPEPTASTTALEFKTILQNLSAHSPKKPETPVTTAILHDISTLATTLGSLEYNGDESSTDRLPLAAIVGITVGVIVMILVGVLIIIVYERRRKETTGNEEHENEMEINEVNKLLRTESSNECKQPAKTGKDHGNEKTPESKESTKDGCKVYVVESKERRGEKVFKKTESSVRVLVLLLVRPISMLEMNSEARKMFGPNSDYCWTVSYYQKHKQEKSATLFAQNIDLENLSTKEIFERIRDVVMKTEVNVNFVLTVPMITWSEQREELATFLDEDETRFKCVYC